jgi:hypothetical protein
LWEFADTTQTMLWPPLWLWSPWSLSTEAGDALRVPMHGFQILPVLKILEVWAGAVNLNLQNLKLFVL